MMSPAHFLELAETDHAALFLPELPVWEALHHLRGYLDQLLETIGPNLIQGEVDPRSEVGQRVYIAPGARVEAFATIQGPAWIGNGTVVRAGAYLREYVIAGRDCVLGNSSEFKHCLLFNRCEVPHFNYVGDSILGYRAHLGAGVICSNVRLDRGNVVVTALDGGKFETGLRKFGAIVGDRTEVGCNSVLNPGSLLGRDCILYPGTSWSGVLGDHRIVKTRASAEIVERR